MHIEAQKRVGSNSAQVPRYACCKSLDWMVKAEDLQGLDVGLVADVLP